MKKARVWMLVIGCLNLLEIVLNADILLNQNGYLSKMVAKLTDYDGWINVEFVHHLITINLLDFGGIRSSKRVLRKSVSKDRYWYMAIVALILIPIRIYAHNHAMRQFIWIP